MGGDKSAREGADVHGRLIPLGEECRSSPAPYQLYNREG